MDALTDDERKSLELAGITTAIEVLSANPAHLARQLGLRDANHIINKVAVAIAPAPLSSDFSNSRQMFSTGDAALDRLLGGGLLPGTIIELAGEGSAGKTQLALQLSIAAMLSRTRNLDYSTCYISTKTSFPTERLIQIFQTRSNFFPNSSPDQMLELLTFEHVSSSEGLLQLLTTFTPHLASRNAMEGQPLRLLVIDAITPLLAIDGPSSRELWNERTATINSIGKALSELAKKWEVAIVVLNEVSDVFSRDEQLSSGSGNAPTANPKISAPSRVAPRTGRLFRTPAGMMTSWDAQSDLFSRTPRRLVKLGIIRAEERKEAKLGLVWTVWLHARLMMSRTARRWVVDEPSSTSLMVAGRDEHSRDERDRSTPPPSKRRRLEEPAVTKSSTLSLSLSSSPLPSLPRHDPSLPPAKSFTYLAAPKPAIIPPLTIPKRNLAVLFNKFGPRGSVDYLIVAEGVITLEGPTVEADNLDQNSVQNLSAGAKKIPSMAAHTLSGGAQRSAASLKGEVQNVDWEAYFPGGELPPEFDDAPSEPDLDADRLGPPIQDVGGRDEPDDDAAIAVPPPDEASSSNHPDVLHPTEAARQSNRSGPTPAIERPDSPRLLPQTRAPGEEYLGTRDPNHSEDREYFPEPDYALDLEMEMDEEYFENDPFVDLDQDELDHLEMEFLASQSVADARARVVPPSQEGVGGSELEAASPPMSVAETEVEDESGSPSKDVLLGTQSRLVGRAGSLTSARSLPH